MSYNPFFNLKAETSNLANFSSTTDETYILLVANDFDKSSDSAIENAVIVGANVIDDTSDDHEAIIGIKIDNEKKIIAKFNDKNILLKSTTVFDNDILPTDSNNTRNIGSYNN